MFVHPSLAPLYDAALTKQTVTPMGSMHEKPEDEEEKTNQLAFSGSSSHHFIEPCAYHHSQFELTTYLQMHDEIILLTVSQFFFMLVTSFIVLQKCYPKFFQNPMCITTYDRCKS